MACSWYLYMTLLIFCSSLKWLMVIHIYYKNKLEGEALSCLLKENGYHAVRQNGIRPGMDGRSASPRPELYLVDVLSVRQSLKPVPGLSSGYSTKTVLLGSLRELYYYFKIPYTRMGFVCKSISVRELLNGINRIQDGETFFGQEVKKFIFMKPFEQQKRLLGEQLQNPLTDTEMNVFHEVAREKTTRQIARECYRSVHTINNHRKNIMSKLGINGTFGLGVYAKSKLDEIRTLKAIGKHRYRIREMLEQKKV